MIHTYLEMNRSLSKTIHVDISPEQFGNENRENCIFVENRDLVKTADFISSVTSAHPEDVRPLLANFK